MEKKEIMGDMSFRRRCIEFGLDWAEFEVIDNVIVVKTPKQDMHMLLDENYHIIDFADFLCEKDVENIKKHYHNYITPSSARLEYSIGAPFHSFSIKNIHDVSSRIELETRQNGSPYEFWINGELVEKDGIDNYLQGISYLKFMEEEIEFYWKSIYQLRLLDYQTPNINAYLRDVKERMNTFINQSLEVEVRPHPVDILGYIGQPNFQKDGLLYDVIDLLMNDRGYKAKSGTLDKIEKISDEERLAANNTLSSMSNMLKLLDVPYPESAKQKRKV